MKQHCANAREVADSLTQHPAVRETRYPNLRSDPGYETAQALLPNGCGGQSALDSFNANLKLCRPWVSLGDTGSLVYGRHAEPRKGIPEGFARLSVGLEDADDIVADLEQALDKAQMTSRG
jgi:cystathionine beta-lyase/cystathionine gamma-synthase